MISGNFYQFKIRFFAAAAVFCLLFVASELVAGESDTLQKPKTLHTDYDSGEVSLLVYPENGPTGYTTTKQLRDRAAGMPRKYPQTPTPETVEKTATITPVTGFVEENRAIHVTELASTPRMALPRRSSEQHFRPTPAESEMAIKTAIAPEASRPRPVVDPLSGDHPEIDPFHPPVRTASFQGVTPGVTSINNIGALWGPAIQTTTVKGLPAHLYSLGVLDHVEVIFKDNIVRSIVVQLEEPFPEEQVREVLKAELLKSKPVLIPDEDGDIIGEVFPEKGVLFLFEPNDEGLPMVRQIGIEPVSAEPFVLRAEATMNDQPTEARRDLIDAARVDPKEARAYWMLAQIELMEGHVEAALVHCERAIRIDQRRPGFHLTYVQTLMNMNRIEEAKLYLEETIGICDRFPHEKARALSMLGDLYRMSVEPDYEIAIECHSNAIRLAMTLIDHGNQTIRLAARDVLLEAHLGAAKDVAWGRWDNKEESIKKWISRAREISRDPEILAAKRISREYPLKIAACVLAAQVGLPNKEDIEPYIHDVLDAGDALIQATRDPILLRKYQWETSLSLYDAVQIYQLRKKYVDALKYGEIAAGYMEEGIKGRKSDTDMYLLGRLYFRLGAIHAIGNKNHRAAIEWYDLAKPVFETLLPKINPEALGRLGETMVSMGVSYWMTQQQEEAIRITERGLKQIERGVRSKTIEESALVIPYSNLESMYRDVGQKEKADRYKKMASAVEAKMR